MFRQNARMGYGGPEKIRFSEIYEYKQITNINIPFWIIKTILHMDDVYLAKFNELKG